MPRLRIDGHRVEVPAGGSLLEAASKAGIQVPTLCHDPALPPEAGCMVCVVEDLDLGRIVPACTAVAREGADIATHSPAVLAARRNALEMLLSNHPADCEAPCQLACPCHMEIPLMLRTLARHEADDAAAIVRRRIALPGVLSHVCSAPCERACRRGSLDKAIAICSLKRLAAELGRAKLRAGDASGRRVTVIGAGPAGLAAACFLRLAGHACTLFDRHAAAGGSLVEAVAGKPAAAALAADLAALETLGIDWQLGRAVGPDATVAQAAGDAVIVACGRDQAPALAALYGVDLADGFLAVDRQTLRTRQPAVFAAGSAVRACDSAAQAHEMGRRAAESALAWLAGREPAPAAAPFRSHAGHLTKPELSAFSSSAAEPICLPSTAGEAAREAGRCLHCDCRKASDCRLRAACSGVRGRGGRWRGHRVEVSRVTTAAGVVVEPAKCVACGLCVRWALQAGAAIGPSLNGRGFDLRVSPPAGRTWDEIPPPILRQCAAACPTGALACEEGREDA